MIEPSGYRVLVKQIDVQEVDEVYKRAKAAGIHLEKNDRDQAAVDQGKVIAIGKIAFKDHGEPWCEVGNIVAFAKYSGKTVTDPDDKLEYLVVNDEDIVCVIKETI